MRLDKALGGAGLSRADAKRAIRAGRVSINGVAAKDPSADIQGMQVCLDGMPIEQPGHTHIMVHKPAGVITATEDPRFETVLDLVPTQQRRRGLGPVGRLDRDVTGLVILTTDGQLAHRLISPRHNTAKTYIALVEGVPGPQHVQAFEQGITLSDFTAKPAGLKVLAQTEQGAVVEVILTEGKFHQVKRMFAAIGHPVLQLKRVSVAGVQLDEALSPGQTRPLTPGEITALYIAAGMQQEDV